jgi:hypothetical protein
VIKRNQLPTSSTFEEIVAINTPKHDAADDKEHKKRENHRVLGEFLAEGTTNIKLESNGTVTLQQNNTFQRSQSISGAMSP